MTLDGALARADHIRVEVARVTQGSYPDETRMLILVAYLDLAMEHHEAIGLLVRRKLYGSAFALVRVIFEILFQSHWMGKCATQADVEKLAFRGNFEFAPMGSIVRDIDSAYGTQGFFDGIKMQGWKAMNAYTHSGLLQLSKRFRGTKVEPNYSEIAILEFLDSISAALILQGLLLTRAVGRTAEAGEMERLMESFAEDRTPGVAS